MSNARLQEEAKKEGISIFIDIDGPFAECSGDEYFEREFHGRRQMPTLKERPMRMFLLLLAEARKNYKKVEIVTISSWGKTEVVFDFIPFLKSLCPSDLKMKHMISDIHFKPSGTGPSRQKTVNEHLDQRIDGWDHLVIDDSGGYNEDCNWIKINGWDGFTFTNLIEALVMLDFQIGETTYFKPFLEKMKCL